jgi:DNA-binding NarL/FixJ family response regulator
MQGQTAERLEVYRSSSPSESPFLTVLFLDENSMDLQSWSSALTGCWPRYSILKASSLRRGLALCRYEKVDCVVLDMGSPNTFGFRALFELICDRKRPSVAVVVLTSLVNRALHDIVVYHGAQACLVKDRTSADGLNAAIRKAVATVASIR